MKRLGVTLVVAFLGGACSNNYVSRMSTVRQAYEAGNTDEAVRQLDAAKKEEGETGINRLLVMLDKGMVLHAGGRWKESNETLHQADELSKQLDFTSISEEGKTLLTNEGSRVYRGEDFEKLMISMLLALNYFELGQDEDAVVEVRRINERITKMISEEKKPYEQLAIANYLGGTLWEDQKDLDAAAIDYVAAAKQLGKSDWAPLAGELLALLKKTERDDTYRAVKKLFPDLTEPTWSGKVGQVVVIVEAGRAPMKEKSNHTIGDRIKTADISIPVYPKRSIAVPRATVTLDDAGSRKAAVVTSIDEVAKVHLDDRIGKLLAKQVGSLLLKAGIAAGVGAATKNEAVGALTFLALSATNQGADTRSWLTLPAEFQVARVRAEPGTHAVVVDFAGRKTTHSVEVKPGRVALVVVRRF